MELLVKPEMLTSCIYGPTFGNTETVSFLKPFYYQLMHMVIKRFQHCLMHGVTMKSLSIYCTMFQH